MGEFVLYVRGASSGVGYDTMDAAYRADDEHTAAAIRALRETGHTVVQLGDAQNGFTLAELAAVVRDYPHLTNIVLNLHGDEQPRDKRDELRHGVRCGASALDENGKPVKGDEKGSHWIREVFSTIADNTFDQPLNIYLLSCGSRAAYLDIDVLPYGSTLVTYTSFKDSENTTPSPAGFRVPYVRARNFAEQLALNLQAYGLVGDENILSLSVHRADMSIDCSFESMWDNATMNSYSEPHAEMPHDFVRMMRQECTPYMSDSSFNGLIEVLHMQATHTYKTETHVGTRSKVKVHTTTTMDQRSFRDEVERCDLMHALGIYGYMLTEKFAPTGAFQTQPMAFYTSPAEPRPTRPNPLERLGLDADETKVLETLIEATAAPAP